MKVLKRSCLVLFSLVVFLGCGSNHNPKKEDSSIEIGDKEICAELDRLEGLEEKTTKELKEFIENYELTNPEFGKEAKELREEWKDISDILAHEFMENMKDAMTNGTFDKDFMKKEHERYGKEKKESRDKIADRRQEALEKALDKDKEGKKKHDKLTLKAYELQLKILKLKKPPYMCGRTQF